MSEGERVIRGTRRPDGTYRKDVKVKAGYTPQDEQPVYIPRGAQVSHPDLDTENADTSYSI